MPLKAGTRLGPYEIIGPLGAGGMGEVYQARDTRLDRSVAIKILPSHLSGDKSFRQRLEREARAVSSLNHPHICTLHDVGREGEVDYLVMEHLSGETLAERVKRDGPLPPDQVLLRATEIADALDSAHRQGIIHRDLKPANIMLTDSGAKLLDFGLAKITGTGIPAGADGLTSLPTEAHSLTAAGSILGTFQYMAPEQLEGKEADVRSDLFALGAVIFEMATGRRAFDGNSQASLIAAILERQPPSISSLQPLTSPALDRVAQTCMAKNPDDRWQTAHDVMLQLRWATEAGSQAGTPAPVTARRKNRERLAWLLAGGLALALAATGATALFYRSSAMAPKRLVRSSIMAPQDSTFQFAGDLAGPLVISPDGRRVAFAAAGSDGASFLWVRDLDALNARRLNETDGAAFPFWSADSRFLGFFIPGKLRRVDADGGPALTVVEASGGRGGTWSLDDIIVYTPDFQSGLFQVSASGGTPEPLTEPDRVRHTTHRWPHFLPDGKHFLFVAVNHTASTLENDAIYVGSLEGGEPTLVVRASTNAQYASGHLLFLRERTLMAQPFDPDSLQLSGSPVPVADKVQSDRTTWRAVFSASQEGTMVYRAGEAFGGTQMVWMDRKGNVLSTVGEKTEHGNLALSPDGESLAVDRLAPPDIWIHHLTRGVQTRFTFDPKLDNLGVWSPDGSEIAFQSTRDGSHFNIYRKSTTGSAELIRLTESDKHQFATDWSADGRLLFTESAKLGVDADIGVLQLDGGDITYPLNTPFFETSAVFSPDTLWIAYGSDESGTQQIYVMPSTGTGGKWQISTDGGNNPQWRNEELFYWSPRGLMMVVTLETTGNNLRVGTPHSLFPVRIDPQFRTFEVSADGQQLLVNTMGEDSGGPATLVMNWTEGLE